MNQETIIGLDYGGRRIGVAKVAKDDSTAVVVGTLTVVDMEDALAQVVRTVNEHKAERVVVGLPLSLAGSETQQTAATRAFIEALTAKLTVPVAAVDERLTTKQGGSDAGAAVVLLQSYVDREAHD